MEGIVTQSLLVNAASAATLEPSAPVINRNGGGRLDSAPQVAVTPCQVTIAQRYSVRGTSAVPTLAVLHVTAGRERGAIRRVAGQLGSLASDVFTITREMPKRINGAWDLMRETLYPGYIFIQLNDASDLPMAGKLLHATTLSALDPCEAELLLGLSGREHLIRVSYGDIVDGKLQVHMGPLHGREHLVAHIDRHRRKAWLQIPGISQAEDRKLGVGLEVMSKS